MKVKGQRKIYRANSNERKLEGLLISDKANCRTRNIMKNKGRQYIMIRGQFSKKT